MDFSDTPEEAAFREEAKEWLVRNMPTSEELEGLDHIGRAKFWEKRKFDHGWSCISSVSYTHLTLPTNREV